MTVTGVTAAQQWMAALDDIEHDLDAAECLLLDVAPPAPGDDPLGAWCPPALPALTSLDPATAALTAARAAQLLDRLQRTGVELSASLVMLRRHRDLVETVSPPHDRPRFVDWRA